MKNSVILIATVFSSYVGVGLTKIIKNKLK